MAEVSKAELHEHAVLLQQTLNVSIQSELALRRELDEYRKAEIEGLRARISEMEDIARQGLLEAGGIEPEDAPGD